LHDKEIVEKSSWFDWQREALGIISSIHLTGTC